MILAGDAPFPGCTGCLSIYSLTLRRYWRVRKRICLSWRKPVYKYSIGHVYLQLFTRISQTQWKWRSLLYIFIRTFLIVVSKSWNICGSDCRHRDSRCARPDSSGHRPLLSLLQVENRSWQASRRHCDALQALLRLKLRYASYTIVAHDCEGWKQNGSGSSKFYSKLIKPDSEWWKVFSNLLVFLEAKDLPVVCSWAVVGLTMIQDEVHAIFNPTLVNNFINNRELIKSRLVNSPQVFNSKQWQKSKARGINIPLFL